jgi:hypothetical protein
MECVEEFLNFLIGLTSLLNRGFILFIWSKMGSELVAKIRVLE